MNLVTLHAAHPTSLDDPALAALVKACAQETAEHHGIAAPEVTLLADRIELRANVAMPLLLAIAGEVRRSTGRWHLAKYGAQLWRGD